MLSRTLIIAVLLTTVAGAAYAQGTVEGTVVSSTNGQLLPRATVYLRNTQKRDDISPTRADDHGHFIFRNIGEGQYEVTAERQGFFYESRRGLLRTSIELQAGEHRNGIVVRLLPFAAITGRIVDEHEDPIEHVEVRLMATQYFRGHPIPNKIGMVHTDD